MNVVAEKRFAKRQQMHRSKRGAHLMFQTRTRVLDDTLRAKSQAGIPASSTSRPQITQNMSGLLDPTDFDTSFLPQQHAHLLVDLVDLRVQLVDPLKQHRRRRDHQLRKRLGALGERLPQLLDIANALRRGAISRTSWPSC